MNHTYKASIVTASVWLVVSIHLPVQAQVGMTAAHFLQTNTHVRSVGLAEADVALRNNLSGIHLNPATFGKPNTVQLVTQLNLSFDNNPLGSVHLPRYYSDYHMYMPVLTIGFDKLSVGYQFTYLRQGPGGTYSDADGLFGRYLVRDQAHTLAISYDLHSHLAVGAGLNFIKSKLEPAGLFEDNRPARIATNATLDLGAYGEYPMQYRQVKILPSAGWSLTDVGGAMRYSHDPNGHADPMPMMMRGGLGLRLTPLRTIDDRQLLSIAGYVSLSKIMARKDTAGNVMPPVKALFNSWDSFTRYNGQDYVTVNPGDQLVKHMGIEVTILEKSILRFGHLNSHPNNGNRNEYMLGYGLKFNYITIGYTLILSQDQPNQAIESHLLEISGHIPFSVLSGPVSN